MDDDMTQFMGQRVDSYLKLAPSAKLTKAPTPFVDPHVIPHGYAGSFDVEGELDIGNRGELAFHVGSVLMQILYGAREVRWDLFQMCQHVGQEGHEVDNWMRQSAPRADLLYQQ